MKLEYDILFAEILNVPTILICGEEEEMDGHALIELLHVFNEKGRAIRHVFFSKANPACRNYLKSSSLVEGTEYFLDASDEFIRKKLDTPLFKVMNLIVCGFPQLPDDRLYNLVEVIAPDPETPYLFFSKKPTKKTLEFWESRKAYVNSRGVGLAGLIKLQSPDSIEFEKKDEHFEKNFIPGLQPQAEQQHEDFLYRAKGICQVVGMKGMGKKTFINELIQKEKILNPLFFTLAGEESGRVFIEDLSIRIKLDPGLGSSNSQPVNIQETISRIKERLEEFREVAFILFDAEKALNGKDRFSDEILLLVLEHLPIASPKFKIYLVSDREILFDSRNIKTTSVFIDPLEAEKIAKLVYRSYSGAPKFVKEPVGHPESEIRLGLDPEKLLQLTGGHPGITEAIISEFKYLPLNEWGEDPAIEQEIAEIRDNYVEKILNANDEDLSLLKFLSLFEEDFEYDAIQELHTHPAKIVSRLSRRRILTLKVEKGRNLYSLPILIKQFFRSTMSPQDYRIYSDRVARYYKYKSAI